MSIFVKTFQKNVNKIRIAFSRKRIKNDKKGLLVVFAWGLRLTDKAKVSIGEEEEEEGEEEEEEEEEEKEEEEEEEEDLFLLLLLLSSLLLFSLLLLFLLLLFLLLLLLLLLLLPDLSSDQRAFFLYSFPHFPH